MCRHRNFVLLILLNQIRFNHLSIVIVDVDLINRHRNNLFEIVNDKQTTLISPENYPCIKYKKDFMFYGTPTDHKLCFPSTLTINSRINIIFTIYHQQFSVRLLCIIYAHMRPSHQSLLCHYAFHCWFVFQRMSIFVVFFIS